MVWSIFWFLFGLFLSTVLLVAVVGLFAKSARLVRLQLLQGLGHKRKAWREAVEVAGTAACVSRRLGAARAEADEVADPLVMARVDALLPLAECVKPRRPRELREWVLAKCDAFAQIPELREPVIRDRRSDDGFHGRLRGGATALHVQRRQERPRPGRAGEPA